jgi:hypothetical protein|tara:strand:- start:1590 stop:2489 length:900 start_codon:yes stop_codon:yes gene_type:complete
MYNRINDLFKQLSSHDDKKDKIRLLNKIEQESLKIRCSLFRELKITMGEEAYNELKLSNSFYRYYEALLLSEENNTKELYEFNRHQNIKILNKKTDSPKNNIIFIFSSRVFSPETIDSYLFESFFTDSKAIYIFVRDPEDAFYTKGISRSSDSLDKCNNLFLDLINNLVKEKKVLAEPSICTIGASSGGFAALYFGAKLGAKKTLVFSPQLKIPREEVWLDSYLISTTKDISCEIETINNIEVHVSSGCLSDMNQITKIKRKKNVNIHYHEFGNEHNTPKKLNEKGLLADIFSNFILKI